MAREAERDDHRGSAVRAADADARDERRGVSDRPDVALRDLRSAGGSARARLRGAEGLTRESVAAFEQVVLRALEETENALVNYREDQQRLVKLAEQARESSRAAAIARVRYREGAADFLALLDAERTQLQAEDAVAEAEAGVFTSVIAVYKALGGIPAA